MIDFLKKYGSVGLLLVSSAGVYAAEEGSSGGSGAEAGGAAGGISVGAAVALGVLGIGLVAVAVDDDDDDARAETVSPPTTTATTTTATTATTTRTHWCPRQRVLHPLRDIPVPLGKMPGIFETQGIIGTFTLYCTRTTRITHM